MSTQNNKAKAKESTEIWDVQVAHGPTLRQLEVQIIAQGLREGWLTLDDTARRAGEITWRPIREAFAKTFEVAVFLDPPQAYARKYGSIVGALLAFFNLFGSFLVGGIKFFDLELVPALLFAFGMLSAVLGLVRGNFLILLIGFAFAAGLAGVPVSLFLNASFILGLSIGASLTALVGWGIGYGLGYLIGRSVGSRRRGLHQLPAVRQPVPDDLEKESSQKPPALFDRQEVVDFYKTTHAAWSSGQLDSLDPDRNFRREAKKSLDEFVKKSCPPVEGEALYTFLSRFSPQPGEFLVGYYSDWFVLTNLRLVQKDGKDNTFHEIPLAEVKSFKSNARSGTLTFELETGQLIELSKLSYMPKDEFLGEMIKRARSH